MVAFTSRSVSLMERIASAKGCSAGAVTLNRAAQLGREVTKRVVDPCEKQIEAGQTIAVADIELPRPGPQFAMGHEFAGNHLGMFASRPLIRKIDALPVEDDLLSGGEIEEVFRH